MKKRDVLFVLILMLLLTSCKQDAAGPSDTPASAAPSITQHPANVTLMVGQTATFSVVATGTSPLSYQWQKNGVNISGATNSSYSLVVSASDSGALFRCVVSNAEGSVTSSAGILNAVSAPTPPVITVHPPSTLNVFAGDTVTLTMSATGTAPLFYQWKRNGVVVTGATNTSYTFVASMSDSGKIYQGVALNTAGSATTNPTTMGVTQLIEIGRPMNGGVICYVDATGQHGLYFKKFQGKPWQEALDTASVLGGTVPIVLQLQNMLYPNKVAFGLTGVNYWSSEESPTDNRFALSVIFNDPYNPQYNGNVAHSSKPIPNPFVVLFQF